MMKMFHGINQPDRVLSEAFVRVKLLKEAFSNIQYRALCIKHNLYKNKKK